MSKTFKKLNDNESRDIFRTQFQRTQPCRFFQQGRCRRGDNCSFAHGKVEAPPDLTKTSLCKRWMKGNCPHSNEECDFAHGHKELRHTPLFTDIVNQRGSSPGKKKASPASTTCPSDGGADKESDSCEEESSRSRLQSSPRDRMTFNPMDFIEPMKVNLSRFDGYAHPGDSIEPMKVTEFSSFQGPPSVFDWSVTTKATLADPNHGNPSKSLEDTEMEHCLLNALRLSL